MLVRRDPSLGRASESLLPRGPAAVSAFLGLLHGNPDPTVTFFAVIFMILLATAITYPAVRREYRRKIERQKEWEKYVANGYRNFNSSKIPKEPKRLFPSMWE